MCSSYDILHFQSKVQTFLAVVKLVELAALPLFLVRHMVVGDVPVRLCGRFPLQNDLR